MNMKRVLLSQHLESFKALTINYGFFDQAWASKAWNWKSNQYSLLEQSPS